MVAPTPQPDIITLRPPESTSLRDQLIQGLGDGQPTIHHPGSLPYSRTIPTQFLYSDRGLSIYDEITKTEAYYPFFCEREILETYGDEIAARMFGLPTQDEPEQDEEESDEDIKTSFDKLPPNTTSKERWGDETVGTFNNGVNGSSNSVGGKRALAVELGSGSLDKTRHLLRSLAKMLQQKNSPRLSSVEYKALDLEHKSLVQSLESLGQQEPDYVKLQGNSEDSSSKVFIGGLHADYWEGLQFLKDRSPLLAATKPLPGTSAVQPASNSSSTSIMWLGSSIGNLTRGEAVDFMKNILLAPGDTMLIGIDNCDDGDMIGQAYNDPQGVTRRFILAGVDEAGLCLHGNLGPKKGLIADNFSYVSRYNKVLGRHEAYLRCETEDLRIPFPASETNEEGGVTLKKGELVHIEISTKYTQPEALALFHASGFRLVQQWKDKRNLHTVYLIEQPPVAFSSFSPMLKQFDVKLPENPYGLPTMEEWDTMWKAWDMLTLEIIPRNLLHCKPIPLRHIPLFYLGHIAAFRDIHISRYLSEPLTSPSNFAEIFERGIDPDVDEPQKVNHWHSEVPCEEAGWPKVEEIVEYEQRVRERVRKTYAEGKMTNRLARIMMMVFEHEAMHYETLIYIALQASSALNTPPSVMIPDFKSLSEGWTRLMKHEGSSRQAVLTFPDSRLSLGQDDLEAWDQTTEFDPSHAFGWDVENPKREVEVPAFKMDVSPVTNGEYLAWLSKQGSTEGFFPASWSGEGTDEVKVKTLYGEIKLEYAQEWPVAASAVQLQAFAKSKRGRLPTRYELLAFYELNPVDSPTANIGLTNLHPVPATLPSLRRDGTMGGATDGGLWMWSSTTFEAHEGYVGSELYPGYSSDFFDGSHNVIVGASFATPHRLARKTFSNWYQAKYPYVLAGARVAYD